MKVEEGKEGKSKTKKGEKQKKTLDGKQREL